MRKPNGKIFNLLKKYGLTSDRSQQILSKKTRDNDNLKVFRDKLSGVIYIDNFFVGNEVYKSGDYRKNKLDPSFERLSDYERRANDFKKFYVGKKICDFGCGDGQFLKKTQKLTRYSCGIEIQDDYVSELKKEVDIYKDLSEIKKKIDCFFLFHSFEHLIDPENVLEQIKKKISNDGKIIIEVPHANDVLITLYKSIEFLNFTLWSQHLILHTRESLRKILEGTGFKNVIIKGVQRYNFSNHVYWLTKKKPGGHKSSFSLIDDVDHNKSYENMLNKIDKTDTLVAIADVNK